MSAPMSLTPYIVIARPDHWFKHVLMLPGVLLACFFADGLPDTWAWSNVLWGVLSACLVSSSYYVLNEILDAPKDAHHPEKRHRPVPSGQVDVRWAYAEWLVLAAAGIGLGFAVNIPFGICALVLWLAGGLYNVPPIRFKDRPYWDVISESINNPLRLALGWYIAGSVGVMPPLSIMLAYWAFGAFLMAMKRYAEFRHIGDACRAGQYRQSFACYTEERLIESMFFYAACFGLLSGVFMARYHVELVLATPFVALSMAHYMHLGFKPNSPVQHPERLWRDRKFMAQIALAFLACTVLLFTDIPVFRQAVLPSQLPPPHAQPLLVPQPSPPDAL